MTYNPRDYYFQKAKKENFAARSVFKLEEIDQRYRILRSGDKILDLGAWPGSWSQFSSRKIGPKGRILGVDLQMVKLTLTNAFFIQADVRNIPWEQTWIEAEIAPPFDVVLSDMAPKTTGIKVADQTRSTELCEIALEAAVKFLRPGGHFVVKFFHSDDFKNLSDQIKKNFQELKVLRPKSTRKESKEVFLIGKGFKGAVKTKNGD